MLSTSRSLTLRGNPGGKVPDRLVLDEANLRMIDDPRFNKYYWLMKVGLPRAVVCMRFARETGLDPAFVESAIDTPNTLVSEAMKAHFGSWSSGAAPAPTIIEEELDQELDQELYQEQGYELDQELGQEQELDQELERGLEGLCMKTTVPRHSCVDGFTNAY